MASKPLRGMFRNITEGGPRVKAGRWLRAETAKGGQTRPKSGEETAPAHRAFRISSTWEARLGPSSCPRQTTACQKAESPRPLHEDVGRAFALTAIELLMARNGRREVRQCKGDNCGWLFLDHSKGGHRMWCSDASCGTRSRIARFRARLKPKIEEF